MKTVLSFASLAVLLIAPSPCFALWGIQEVSKERAKELGMEVRSEEAGANQVRVELEFKPVGDLKNYTEDKWQNFGRVVLRIGEIEKPSVTAELREDKSKPGRIVVSFTVDRSQLDKTTLWVRVPGELGGTIYDLRVKDFVPQGP